MSLWDLWGISLIFGFLLLSLFRGLHFSPALFVSRA